MPGMRVGALWVLAAAHDSPLIVEPRTNTHLDPTLRVWY